MPAHNSRESASANADGGETFAQVVRDLRHSVNETQEVFAKRFHKVRTYITNTERGDLHAEEFAEDLMREFPEQKDRIAAAYDLSIKRHSRRLAQQRETPFKRRVEKYLQTGRFAYAERALRRGLVDATDAREIHWMYDHLHVATSALGKDEAAMEALHAAVACAVNAGLEAEEITSRERLATRYQVPARFQEAHEILDAGLVRHPHAAELWLRNGKVYWYEQDYSAAYAALTTALKEGTSRTSVLHARGQVLAEWGSFDAAVEDINAYLEITKATSADLSSARSARAYAWGQLGDLPRAVAEFDALEARSSTGAWQHYRRALCYVTHDMKKPAIKYLKRALERDGPPLNPPRREHAERLLADFGVQPPYDSS